MTYVRAGFIANTTIGEYPLNVQFYDQSTTNDTLAINFWAWDFDNDGQVDSYDQNPQWTYASGGSYTVKLIVSNSSLSDSLKRINYINVISEDPTIITIEDIPDDQGGWVKVHFTRSLFDTDSLQMKKTELYTIELYDSTNWMAVNSTGAYGKNIYSVLAHTPVDSGNGDDGLFAFRVIAFMDEGNFVSDTVYGYSVDNIAPPSPTGLTLAINIYNQLRLNWNAVKIYDLSNYRIYRSNDQNFIPSSATLLAELSDTSYIDLTYQPSSSYYYRISAVDVNGNESIFSESVGILSSTFKNGTLPTPVAIK